MRDRRGRRWAAAIVTAVAVAGCFAAPARADGGPVVQTKGGAVRGIERTNYSAWLGIPYAAPPVGERRWKPPARPARWPGVRDATRFGDRCVQGTGWDPGYEQPNLSEDCLYLNVYTPNGSRHDGPRPVFVWIHGGGFTGGAGQDTDPRAYLDASGAVYVTINYRLGALGFLNLPQLREEGDGAGTFGLLDQQAALRWVKRNIARFGGDPGNVTIAGQSAGGSSVCDQLASPTAGGLFQRAIIQSGGCSLTATDDADTAGAAFLTQVGCPDDAGALACLRGKAPADVLKAQGTTDPGIRPSVGGRAFPTDPATAVQTGSFHRVPVISGQVSNERSLFVFSDYDDAGTPVTAASFEAAVREDYGDDADRVLAAYPLSAYTSPGDALSHLRSDAATFTRRQTQQQIARWTRTYVYEFDEPSTPQFTSIYRQQWLGDPARSFPFGATHVDELGYLWDYLAQTVPYSDDQLELGDQMKAYWSAFQSRADPNGRSLPRWPRYERDGAYMALSACATDPAGHAPPGACSAAKDDAAITAAHKLDLWAAVLADD